MTVTVISCCCREPSVSSLFMVFLLIFVFSVIILLLSAHMLTSDVIHVKTQMLCHRFVLHFPLCSVSLSSFAILEAAFRSLWDREWGGKSSIEWIRLHRLQLLLLLPPVSATIFLHKWPSSMFTKAMFEILTCLENSHMLSHFSPPAAWWGSQTLCSLYIPERYMREVNNSFSTWEKVAGGGNGVETQRSFPVFEQVHFHQTDRQFVFLYVLQVTRWT